MQAEKLLILSLDSTAVTAAVALCENEKLLAEYTLNNLNTHSETLLPMIESMLSLCGVKPCDIGLFVCSAGPGSFTGVRIGAATLKGLAFGREVPCVGVSSLEMLAYNMRGMGGIVCPVMNARRGQVYNALFDANGKRLCEDRALAASELAKELENENKTVYLVGDGVDVALPCFSGRGNINVAPGRQVYPSGYAVAMCGLEAYRRGETVTDAELAPTYLRMPQAERERLEKEKNKNI